MEVKQRKRDGDYQKVTTKEREMKYILKRNQVSGLIDKWGDDQMNR